ncbi:uncharacterized protein F21D5.5 [Diabrotica virgifera virgifera]|uniref:PNK FHA domain-containing protein n=1 Tax=Diabrotica virgifera virgifera TaxID=50390 RepID=A0ABM5IRN1_DIAVI|nr:uncharacterized protein F21D5.5 [Diabrotica virgifera virgifera]
MSRKCYLVHLANKIRINLPHGELTTVGRSVETKVDDVYVSKEQIECIADTDSCTVKVKPVGKSICGVDGYAVVKDKTYTLGPGHVIEFRLGFHPFEVVFEYLEEKLEQTAKRPKLEVMYAEPNNSAFFNGAGKWEDIDQRELLIYTPDNIQSQNKIAAFDIDGTIIKTQSGARFPKDFDDWAMLFSDIPSKLQKLYNDNFKIVFFTNQSGIGKDPSKVKGFKRKIENILKKIALPIQVYIALGRSKYRKPITGMWDLLKTQKNDNVKINMNQSFYVGDAAGREKNWAPKKPKDHSSADRLFALNIGIKFYTPEEYFMKSRAMPFTMPEFDPRKTVTETLPTINYDTPNLIVMVGGPGSGKSQFCKSHIVPKNYVHVNRDTLGSWQKCVKLVEESLQKKKNCVVDNTNVDKESRQRYIEVAKKFGVPCRCFVMNTTFEQSKHNNRFRELTDKSHLMVSEIIINNLRKNYQKPVKEEGFDEIVEVPFVPQFNSSENEKLYKMFLLEK